MDGLTTIRILLYYERNSWAYILAKSGRNQVDKIREHTHCPSFVQLIMLLDIVGWGNSREWPSFVKQPNNVIYFV